MAEKKMNGLILADVNVVRMMDKTLEKIKEIISEPISKLDLVVDSIEYVKNGKYNFLNIVLDRINGIDLDTIVEATNIINNRLKVNCIFNDIKNDLNINLSTFIYEKTGRHPIILPIINDVKKTNN